MNLRKTFSYLSFFLLTNCLQALELNEKARTWTRADGQKAQGKLVGVVEDKISLEIRGKVFEFPLSEFSIEDRDYVDGVQEDFPIGMIEKYPVTFSDEKHRAFYEQHSMQSLIWRGENEESMPLMVYQPALKDLEKLPVIVYLHGTGGMGTDNIKPFFSCGGGAAKHLLAKSFQKNNPCIVITPQIQRHSGWYCSHYTDPSKEQIWLKNAIRVMAQEEKYAIDLNRIYIMGHSMGGHGAYEALAKLSDFYAAGVAIAAVDDGASLTKDNVKGNLWIFLNRDDKAETVGEAELFTRKYRKLGGKIKTTIYEAGGHNAWDRTLQDHDFRSLLFKQKRE